VVDRGEVFPAGLHVVALAAQGQGLSGSDRIFIELVRRWSVQNRVVVHVSQEGAEMCTRNGLAREFLATSYTPALRRHSKLVRYAGLTWSAVRRGSPELEPAATVYSASDFWPDVIPAVKAKRRGTPWVAGFYMFAPPLLKGFEGGLRRGLPRPEDALYWLSQRLSLVFIKRSADVVLVTSDAEGDRLAEIGFPSDRIVVVRGGVDIGLADATPAGDGPAYDAVFIGRLHVQKGVTQLIDIWSRVLERRPDARLALIGDGPLEGELAATIQRRRLGDHIDLLGFVDGAPKFAVVKRAKIVVHPALYDSGGMAACEAFACGRPGVSFDLPALRTYYPRGMVKVRPFDLDEFATAIVRLLEDDNRRADLGREARTYAEGWDWDARAHDLAVEIDQALRRAGQ
jgi:glycosyltransferase involved in cell wall biosynthesis